MTPKSQALMDELISAAASFGGGATPARLKRLGEARLGLRTYVEGLEEELRWVPVSERLPDTGNTLKYYDVILEGEDSVAVALWDGWYKNWNLYEVGGGYVSTTLVTHWRERPKLPEVQE